MMRTLLILVVIAVSIQETEGWARRRRLDKRRVVRDVELERILPRVVNVNLEKCTEPVPACGFTIECSCCNNPSFKSCGGTDLIGSPDISLLKRKRRSADTASDIDEAGCHLRSVKYNGDDICIPGNVASMFAIIQQTSDGNCYPLFPLNCDSVLDDSVVYLQHVYVAPKHVQNTLDALAKAGHNCKRKKSVDNESGIICVI